jgi:hypothetical protein
VTHSTHTLLYRCHRPFLGLTPDRDITPAILGENLPFAYNVFTGF